MFCLQWMCCHYITKQAGCEDTTCVCCTTKTPRQTHTIRGATHGNANTRPFILTSQQQQQIKHCWSAPPRQDTVCPQHHSAGHEGVSTACVNNSLSLSSKTWTRTPPCLRCITSHHQQVQYYSLNLLYKYTIHFLFISLLHSLLYKHVVFFFYTRDLWRKLSSTIQANCNGWDATSRRRTRIGRGKNERKINKIKEEEEN